jgi:hypothetical protein
MHFNGQEEQFVTDGKQKRVHYEKREKQIEHKSSRKSEI